jgi:hypothetical protein
MYAGVCGFDPESLEACIAIDGEQYKDGRSEGMAYLQDQRVMIFRRAICGLEKQNYRIKITS